MSDWPLFCVSTKDRRGTDRNGEVANALLVFVDRNVGAEEWLSIHHLPHPDIEAALKRGSRRRVGIDTFVVVDRAEILVDDADTENSHAVRAKRLLDRSPS